MLVSNPDNLPFWMTEEILEQELWVVGIAIAIPRAKDDFAL